MQTSAKKRHKKISNKKNSPKKICLPEKFPLPKNYLPKIIFLILAGKAVLYLQMFPNEFLKCQGWRIEIKYHWSLINYQLSMINYHGSIINDHNDNMSGYYQFNWSCSIREGSKQKHKISTMCIVLGSSKLSFISQISGHRLQWTKISKKVPESTIRYFKLT